MSDLKFVSINSEPRPADKQVMIAGRLQDFTRSLAIKFMES